MGSVQTKENVVKKKVSVIKCRNMEEVREQIDQIDDSIINLLAKRQGYVVQAATFKRNEADVRAEKRVEKVIEKVRGKADLYGVDSDLVEKLYRDMIAGFIQIEQKKFREE